MVARFGIEPMPAPDRWRTCLKTLRRQSMVGHSLAYSVQSVP